MRNSLQDQLLKAGLVDDKTIKQANKARAKARKQSGAKPGQKDEQRLDAERALREKGEKDRQRAAQLNDQAREKELQAQVAQLVAHYRQSRDGGDIAYNFSDDGVIKKIWVSRKFQDQLIRGQLAIVRSNDGYELVPAVAAQRIKERLPQSVVVLNQKQADAVDEDDPYKDFPIPDDLMW